MNRVKVNNDVKPKDRLVAVSRVTKVTRDDHTSTLAATIVVGDGKSVIGWGFDRAGKVTAATQKDTDSVKKNLVKAPVLKGIAPHEAEAHFNGAHVLLKPAVVGAGLRVGGTMRTILESAGAIDVIAGPGGSSSPRNLIEATIAVLVDVRGAYAIAGKRGISMDKVFSG